MPRNPLNEMVDTAEFDEDSDEDPIEFKVHIEDTMGIVESGGEHVHAQAREGEVQPADIQLRIDAPPENTVEVIALTTQSDILHNIL